MIKKSEIAIFTVCNVAYLDKVMVLAESTYNHTTHKLNVFVFDKKRTLSINFEYCNIFWIEDLGIPHFNILSFKYSVIELTTSLKPWIALTLLRTSQKVVFFDPDVMVYDNINVIIEGLDQHPVIITPHYLKPRMNELIDDIKLMRFGQYNLGFFGVNNSSESKEFLGWWSERCLADGYDDTQYGIFTDQKWVSIAPTFFKFICVTSNPGLNVAYWNLSERRIKKVGGKYSVNDEYPLVFVHYSAFNAANPSLLSTRKYEYGKNGVDIISKLGFNYGNKLLKYVDIAEDTKYSYDFMTDGKYISPALRRAYATICNDLPSDHDPFNSSGVVSRFAKRNYLYETNNSKYRSLGYTEIGHHHRKMKYIVKLLRLMLRIIGPNNFMSVSRLFVYLSSYQRVPMLWENIYIRKKNI